MGTIHAANIDHSERMQHIIRLLQERGDTGATTVELSELDADQAVSTTISGIRKQLKARGIGDIDCKYVGKTENQRKVYRYVLVYVECPNLF